MFHSRSLNNKINWIHERALRLVYQNNLSFSELLDLDDSVTVHQKIWELVPNNIKYSNSLSKFKKLIKSWKPEACP